MKKYIQLLEQYYEKKNELQDLEKQLYKKYGTNKKCFKCGKQLLKSDLRDYKYLCLYCDENFYEFETLEGVRRIENRTNY